MISRRTWIKQFGIFVPTIFSAGVHGAVRLGHLDSQVGSWMSRVKANGGNYTSLSVVASDIAMKIARPLAPKILRWNLYCGLNLSACIVPLIANKGTANVDTAVSFTGSPYAESTGLTGDGVDDYINPGFAVDTGWTSDNDCAIGAYLRTKTTALDYIMGIVNGASSATYMSIAYAGTDNYGSMHSIASGTHYATGADSTGTGHYMTVRNASNSLVIYRNGVLQYSTATPSGTRSTVNPTLVVHAGNVSGVVSSYSSRTYGGYQICKGMTAAEVLIFYNAIQRANTILGRQV